MDSLIVRLTLYYYRYMDILKKRTDIPRVIELSRNDYRLVILPGEDKEKTTNIGRPIGAEYWDVQEKLRSAIMYYCATVYAVIT